MSSQPAGSFVKVLETDALADIALIKSILEAEGVRYFLKGENMKFIRPVDPVVLMVEGKDLRPLKLRYLQFNRDTAG